MYKCEVMYLKIGMEQSLNHVMGISWMILQQSNRSIKGIFSIAIHAEVAGQCDRCVTGVVQDPSASCTAYSGTSPCA